MMAAVDLRGRNVPLRFNRGDHVVLTLDHGGSDVSAYTGWAGAIAAAAGGTPVASFTVGTAQAAAGIVTLSMGTAVTEALTGRDYVWWVERAETASQPRTIISGAVQVDPQGARGGASTSLEVQVTAGTVDVTITPGGDVLAHINDPTDAHDASAISVIPTGNLAADDVQAAFVELHGEVNGAKATAAANLLAKLDQGVDACMLVVSDSTATDTWEWVYLLAEQLAEDWPTHDVDYYLWSNSTLDYAAVDQIQSGTGTGVLRIYNASFGGVATDYVLGANWANAVQVDHSPDVVIVSHGHNEATEATFPERYTALVESLRAEHPGAATMVMTQNPRTIDTRTDVRARQIRRIAADMGYDLVDVWMAFNSSSTPLASLLDGDGVHPNAALGGPLWLSTVYPKFRLDPENPPVLAGGGVPALLSPAQNLLVNGGFTDGGTASGWTVTTATLSADSGRVDGPHHVGSVKIVATAAGARIDQSIVAAAVAGQTITVAARVWIDAGSDQFTGRLQVIDSTGATKTSNSGTAGQGGWRWLTLTYDVPVAVTSVNVRLYCQTTSGSGTATIWVDRITCWYGSAPRDSEKFGNYLLSTVVPALRVNGNHRIGGALAHDGSTVGFYGTTPVAKQTGVPVTAAGIHAALVSLGLISA